MALIFLAFANDPNDPLPTLSREDDEVYRQLSTRAALGHFKVHRDSNTNLSKVAEYITRFKDELTVFLFSGHAERDRLFMGGQTVQSVGIAELLGQCPKLKLVVLNGCSTFGQVKQLLALPNRPAVISTSAPVGDFTATQFSSTFFQTLSEQKGTVKAAFTMGLAAAKASSEKALPLFEMRGMGRKPTPDEPVWLLDGREERLGWKLPSTPVQTKQYSNLKPNQIILKELLESLAQFDSKAKDIIENKNVAEAGRRRLKKGNNLRRNAILKSLPLPISEQIEKLLSKRRENNHIFYDTFSLDRLRQILHTYEIALELPSFIQLAQLYDLLSDDQQNINVSFEASQIIKSFLKSSYADRFKVAYFPLLKTVSGILQTQGIQEFVPELATLNPEEDVTFFNAFKGLELKKANWSQLQGYEDHQIVQECIEAEAMLTTILSKLNFLASYSLVSIRNIDVLRNRLFRTPSFIHRVVHLAKRDSGDPEEEEELLDDFLASESVLLMKKQPLTGQVSFLNLTPFVIDENAYVKKVDSHIYKLHYFHHFDNDTMTYFYKHTYKPEDNLLEIFYQEGDEDEDNTIATQDIWDQFNEFWEMLE